MFYTDLFVNDDNIFQIKGILYLIWVAQLKRNEISSVCMG